MDHQIRSLQVSDLPSDLSKPARRALMGAGLLRLEQFTKLSEKELLQLHGVGPKAIHQLRRDLERNGLSFIKNKA